MLELLHVSYIIKKNIYILYVILINIALGMNNIIIINIIKIFKNKIKNKKRYMH